MRAQLKCDLQTKNTDLRARRQRLSEVQHAVDEGVRNLIPVDVTRRSRFTADKPRLTKSANVWSLCSRIVAVTSSSRLWRNAPYLLRGSWW